MPRTEIQGEKSGDAMDGSFWEIPARKWGAAWAIAFSAMSLLCGYEFIRSVSQSLFIAAYGSIRLPLVMALSPIGALCLLYGYGRLLSLVGARRAVVLTSLLSAGAILGCKLAIQAGSRLATGVLYVFREAYIVLLVEQIWSFINSTMRTEEGAKLNGPVCGVASLGAIAGGLLVQHYAKALGSANLLIFAAASLAPTGLFAAWAYKAGGEPRPNEAEVRGRRGHLGGKLLFRTPVFRNLALLVILTQVVSAVADLQLSRFVEIEIPDVDERTQWLGGLYANLNIGSALFQFIAAPAALSLLPLRAVHMAIPLVHMALALFAFLRPGLWSATAMYMVFTVFDYSLFRSAKELLYIPLSYDARYRAKELIDAFGYRMAKGMVGGSFAAVGHWVTLSAASYPIIAIGALAGWLPLALLITRHRTRPNTPESDANTAPRNRTAIR